MGYPLFQNPQFVPQQSYVSPTVVNVRSKAEALTYPVGLGNSVTFKDVNQPFMYTKTMGFSQLDAPLFEVYQKVEENTENQSESQKIENDSAYALKTDLEPIMDEIKALKEEMKKTVKQTKTTKEKADE